MRYVSIKEFLEFPFICVVALGPLDEVVTSISCHLVSKVELMSLFQSQDEVDLSYGHLKAEQT